MNSKFTTIVRVLLGLLLLASGLNKFFNFLPSPGTFSVSYIFPVVGTFEIIIAAMLLLKKWVPFALVALVPISINILLFHFYTDINTIGPALLVAILNGILIYKHWRAYKPLFLAY